MAQHSDPDFEHLLTPRQREIRGLLRHGFTNGEIARKEQISEAGVKYHVTEILNKLGVNNRWEAGHWPDDPPWGAAVFAPFALLWRKIGERLPFDVGSAANTVSGPASSATSLAPSSPPAFAATLGALALLVSAIMPSDPSEVSKDGDEIPTDQDVEISAPASPTTVALAFLVLTPPPHPPSTMPSPTITPADALLVAEIAAGGFTDCVLSGIGGVGCRGVNEHGEFDGEAGTTSGAFGPVKGLESGVRSLSLGLTVHGCALQGEVVKCWGANAFGQLGDGTTDDQDAPVIVELDVRVTDVGAGNNHTCALTALTTVLCWGDNTHGQLGAPTSQTCMIIPKPKLEAPCSRTPVEVCADEECSAPLSGVIAIAVGSDHTCAVLATGDLKCWGLNDAGQLGAEAGAICAGEQLGVPVQVPCSSVSLTVRGLTETVVVIAAGGGFTCALTTANEVWCWGDNTFGQLGTATAMDTCGTHFLGRPIRTPCSRTPVKVRGLGSDIVAIDAGGSHTCALNKSGKSWCWGLNNDGQLGTKKGERCPFLFGTVSCSPTPIELVGDDWIDVSAGPIQTCAVHEGGSYACWGGDILAAWKRLTDWMGRPTPSPTPTPTPTQAGASPPASTATPTPGKVPEKSP